MNFCPALKALQLLAIYLASVSSASRHQEHNGVQVDLVNKGNLQSRDFQVWTITLIFLFLFIVKKLLIGKSMVPLGKH